jgi:hypothetical protein
MTTSTHSHASWALVALGLLAACGPTAEQRAWAARRADLERRQAELKELEARAPELAPALAEWDALRASLDLAGFARTHRVNAQVFTEPGQLRAKLSGSLQGCVEGLRGFAPVSWLLPHWRLRLEGDHCEWEGHTGAAFEALERKVVQARPTWAPPPHSVFSRGIDEEKARVLALEADLVARERRLGGLATLGPISEAVKAAIAELKAAPPSCPLVIVEREQAQDTPGARLEVTDERPVHPLEPSGDPRLRGLLEAQGERFAWRCPAP